MAMWLMHIAYWIPKATNAHSEFTYSDSVIAFPLQKWFHENASALCYTYIACIVALYVHSLYCCVIRTFLVLLRYTYIACVVIL